ncbi:beta-ketoacyl-[acyl-carrier-protein] synthase II [Bacteroidetes/Chlorobi group bacterium MS-B_bin-24]|jgi:3-oxoacyl-[acyl-carrier-protein] synthase II|nr:MAG: beta-ketoacyl-[acyl-carrier-protein] synthase II [Bacteroidetes/Chlorobi group bacterium MS-B_bin-24]
MPKYNFPRVVVTGIGVVTPIGNTVEEFWNAMLEGKSGADYITRFDTTHFETKFACEVKNFDPLLYLNRKEVQRMDLFTQFAIAAATQALQDSGLNLDKINKERTGVIFGSGIGGMWTYHYQQQLVYENNGKPDRISPFFIPMMISDIAAGHIAIRWGFKGPNYATTSACATASHSLADALMLIQRGDADIMVVGGSEAAICPMGVGGFNAMKALSTRNDDPKTASRPFDKDRDGFVMGEGAGVLILETLEHALNRGAKIYTEFAGFGLTDDAFHITQPAPNGEGAYRSMKLALEDAGLQPQDIDYINAHGTSTPYNDKNETEAIKTLFGDYAYKINISSTKSMTGHLLGAAGAVEAIATVLAIERGIIPPTINYFTPDSECDLNYTPNKPVQRKIRAALSNTFGFGGHNATLAFKAFEV